MKQKAKGIFWGLILVLIGVFVALEALDINIPFDIFFDGWWTLFIIVPCTIEFFTSKNKFGNFLCILIGVGLLLAARDIIDYSDLFKLILPAFLILLGIYVIFRTFVKKKQEAVVVKTDAPKTNQTTGKTGADYSAIFAGEEVRFDGQRFEGTSLTAVFGGVECDLRGALIEHDVVINATAIFGGVDIYLPEGVRLHVESSMAFLGGVDNTYRSTADASVPLVTIRPTCLFGGVDIK